MYIRGLLALLVLSACSSGSGETASSDSNITTFTSGASTSAATETGATTDAASGSQGSSEGDPTTTSPTTDPTAATTTDTTDPTDATGSTDPTTDATTDPTTTTGSDDTRAYLHADLWSTFWNDRTRCGAERTFLHLCQQQGGDCSLYQQAYDVCNPAQVVYGQVGPEKVGEELCMRSKYPEIGGCEAYKYDFETLQFWWYGAEWQGNWPVSTLKVFGADVDWTGDGELIALSNLPGVAQAAMAGIDNHGYDYGCAMPGSEGDDGFLRPFGGFAWVEVPIDMPVTIVGASASNFGGMAFAGCNRGEASQNPWVTGAPGAQLGCVHLIENMTFSAGHHYYFHHGQIEDLGMTGPPQDVIDGFALPEVGIDISSHDACAL